MNIWVILRSLNKNCLEKKKILVLWPVKQISEKEYGHVLNVWNKSETNTTKDYHDLYLKCEGFLADVVQYI